MAGRSVRLLVILITAVLFGAVVTAIPVSAAPGGTLTGSTLNATDCYVILTAQVQDAGFYAINVWDDGSFRAGAGTNVAAGGTLSIRLTIGGPILQGAAGIGVYLENGVGTSATTTFASNGSAQLWSDTVGNDCASRGFTFSAIVGGAPEVCIEGLPGGTPIYSVPNGAPAYFAASLDTYTGFNLPAGTWYVTEFTGDFAKVWITCTGNPVYIPVSAVVR